MVEIWSGLGYFWYDVACIPVLVGIFGMVWSYFWWVFGMVWHVFGWYLVWFGVVLVLFGAIWSGFYFIFFIRFWFGLVLMVTGFGVGN